MKIAVLKEAAGEPRCAAIPETVKKFAGLGRGRRGRTKRGPIGRDQRRRFRRGRSQRRGARGRSQGRRHHPRHRRPGSAVAVGSKAGRVAGGCARPAWPARADRCLCQGRARCLGDGMDATDLPRAVDGHIVLAVQPCRLQSGGRRGGGLWPRLPDDDDRRGHRQPGQGVCHGCGGRRSSGDCHRQALGRPGQRDRRPLRHPRTDHVLRRQADLRRECRGHRGRGLGRLRHRNVAGISERPRPSW